MKIIPSIDLYNQQCVRLYQGKFDQCQDYGNDPLAIAKNYAKQGATDLHVVDLNGTRDGKLQHVDQILAIKKAASLRVQVGGGLRDQQTIEDLLAAGIDAVVLGSLAVKNPELTQQLIATHGVEKIILAIDVQINEQPMVAIHGWQSVADQSLWSLLAIYQQFPNLQVLCTDISKDGTLGGCNVALYQQCMEKYPQLRLQASGGIGSLADLQALKNTDVTAVIVGKALYENRFTLTQAIEVTTC